ncbi:uncharacterized protein [Hetaerina americana]|uniref:uncharacterized protein n=1 Tax=Hetaerina americana TaxID=62018 RepID=UPI003A7F1AFA
MGTRSPSRGEGGRRGVAPPEEEEVAAPGAAGAERRRGEGLRPRTPSEGREVRCACQYFQTDSLLPERSAIAALWKHHRTTMGDHEYEPVAAPPPRPAPPPVFLGWEADEDPEEMKQRLEASADGGREELERQFLRSGLEDDPGPPPADGAGEEEAMEEIQGTPPSPSPPPLSRTPTADSRTDCELTTSQVESSGLEELPLRRGARARGGGGPLATTIKRKIRNQAGRLRSKMRSIPRPTFKVPEGLMRGKGAAAPAAAEASTTQDSASSAADTMERPLRTEKKRTAAHLFDFRTYPRIIERKLKARGEFFSKRAPVDEDNAGGSVAGPPPRKKVPFGTRWAQRFTDIRYADEEETAGSPARENGSTSSLRGSVPGGSWSGGSTGQDVGGGVGGRPGVLEEIDADEFFLREKGLSRDDVRRGEEISSEIRDALRPPGEGVQGRAEDGETEGEEGEEEMEGAEEEEMVEVEMTPPQRPSRRSASAGRQRVVIDQGFMTFPPQRPFRRKGKIVRAAECEDIAPLEAGEEEEGESERAVEEEEDEEAGMRWREGRPVLVEGAIMAESLVRDDWEEGGWLGGSEEGEEGEGGRGGGEQEEEMGAEVQAVDLAPPAPPKRRRRGAYEHSATSLDESRGISTEEVRMEEFDRSSTNVSLKQQFSDSAQIFPTLTTATVLTSPDPEYASPSRDLLAPVAPRRTRSLPRRSKERDNEEGSSPVPSRASVSVPPRPHRKQKTVTEFFTVPRRKAKRQESPPPQRPARSGYATPGPPRAPVRRRPSTPLLSSIPPSEDMESAEERVKELTAGEVVSKMRGRPLPPPPRPPRRGHTHSAERSSWEEVVEGHLTLGSDRAPESITSAKSLSAPPDEVSIAIQTDPLPYEYCMEDGALEESAPPTESGHTSEVIGRRSPVTWPTPPPTPPPTARRQRRQAATRRATQQAEKNADQVPVPTTAGEPSPRSVEERVPTPAAVAEEEGGPEGNSTLPEAPSIPPLPIAIPPLGDSPPSEPAAPVSVSSPPPPPVPPAPSAETKPPVLEPAGPILLTEQVPSVEESPIQPHSATITPVEMPPIAPPRPPKPTPRPAEIVTPAPPAPSDEPSPSVPPPSFAQLRSPPEEPSQRPPTPVPQTQPMPHPFSYSIPPPYFFPSQPTTEDTQGRPIMMPPPPPMGAVALLCVGEISARKLVVSEFQTAGGESHEATPGPQGPQARRPAGGRRRTPSVPTVRRRAPPRRSQSEDSGGKEGKGDKGDFAEDPEDPEDLPGIGELSGRLARACGNAAVSTVRQVLLTAVERVEGDGRTEAAIIIALVMAVALVILTMGHTRQGHRWDFYLPPAP